MASEHRGGGVAALYLGCTNSKCESYHSQKKTDLLGVFGAVVQLDVLPLGVRHLVQGQEMQLEAGQPEWEGLHSMAA